VTSFHGRVAATQTADGLGPCSALIVPGGMGIRTAAANPALLDAVRSLAARSTWLGATSTGSVLLAAAGLAAGARATTHWLAHDLIEDWGMTCVDATFVEHGRLLTASGLGSSATLAFRLVGALAGGVAEERARAGFVAPPSGPQARVRSSPWRRRRAPEAPARSFVDSAATVVILDLDGGGTTSAPSPELP
jgi:transcriptional regulator GlxA family with amidase domain